MFLFHNCCIVLLLNCSIVPIVCCLPIAVTRLFSLKNIIGIMCLYMGSQVIIGSHYLAVRTCAVYYQIISPLHFRQIYLFPEIIRRFTDRPDHIIFFFVAIPCQIGYFMISLVKSRPDKLCHSCIDNGKFRMYPFLYIKYPCDKFSTLSDYRSSQLKMNLLPWQLV